VRAFVDVLIIDLPMPPLRRCMLVPVDGVQMGGRADGVPKGVPDSSCMLCAAQPANAPGRNAPHAESYA